MPVTAKLSRRFYEQFGDDITNELVDWFNSVDATYQSSLRELNEINFARFDAKLDQRIASVGARIDSLEERLNAKFDASHTYLDSRLAEQREELTIRLAALESRLTRWMVALWSSTMLAVVGLMIAVLRSK
jgi:hypothetical protein